MNTENEIITDDIPADSEVVVGSSSGAWRFANGQIVRGQETSAESGEYQQTRPGISGKLIRVGIFSGESKSGHYEQLECDILTSEGEVHVKSGLTNIQGRLQPSVATLGLARGLVAVAKGEAIRISAALGAAMKLPNGADGKRPTYVNFARLSKKTDAKGETYWHADPIYGAKRDKDAPKMDTVQQWEELEPQIRAHAAYADREARDGDGAAALTHQSELERECAERHWPGPSAAPTVWLEMITALFELKTPPASLSSVTEDQWGDIRNALATTLAEKDKAKVKDWMPTPLRKVAAEPKKKTRNLSALDDPPDPFAKE